MPRVLTPMQRGREGYMEGMVGRIRHTLSLMVLGVMLLSGVDAIAQINAERVLLMGRNALYYEDYVLAIQRFNLVINAKPWLAEPYFYRGLAKFYLEDYQGAEIDCGSALERNPYMGQYYMLRALCSINRGRYVQAETDYVHAIRISPLDKNSWHNLVLCQMELKEYARADSSLDQMIRYWPKDAEHYTLKAQVALALEDSVRAEQWVDQALSLDEYLGQAWSLKAMFQSLRKEYAQAENSLDKALVQLPKMAGLYINRALARYYQDNLRGAMSDYDAALDLDPNNYLGHFNRGLLRASVGEDNLAIEDFDFVLKLEPDNTIALYNRALMLDNVGDYKGAIRDISAVIRDYPQFWEGYRKRAAIRRKIGDVYGAERDEFALLKASMQVAQGTYKKDKRTRKKSEHAIEDYDKLVEEDVQHQENEYASDYRGHVQNRQSSLRVEPIYVISYHTQKSELNTYVPYSQEVENLNTARLLPATLYLTNHEGGLDASQTDEHMNSIAQTTVALESKPHDTTLLLRRALDYYHVRDFENAIADMNDYLQRDPHSQVGLMLRAQCRFAQLEVSQTTSSASDLRLGYLMVLQDYNRALEEHPESPYLLYNTACLMVQLSDYAGAIRMFDQALTLDSKFSDAYYSRGVAHILAGDIEQGLTDLSQAGELGLYTAYSLIKHYSTQKK